MNVSALLKPLKSTYRVAARLLNSNRGHLKIVANALLDSLNLQQEIEGQA